MPNVAAVAVAFAGGGNSKEPRSIGPMYSQVYIKIK